MAATEAQKRATARYDAANTRRLSLKINKNTDEDIIARLEAVDNVQGYIKRLIRADIANFPTIPAKGRL